MLFISLFFKKKTKIMLYTDVLFPYNEPIKTKQHKETKYARFSQQHDGKICR